MKTLTENITHIFGEQGQSWIASLPEIVERLIAQWKLRDVTPVENMTFNYVAKAIAINDQPVMLKISCDEESIANERRALMYFDGAGSIELIDYNDQYHALLIQQAVPGDTLKSIYSTQADYVMDCYVDTMKKLHSKSSPPQHGYKHISDWLTAIDNLAEHSCPSHLLKKALQLKSKLLSSMTTPIFLHGDLHHDNILQHGNQWLAIDPKGVVGEAEFEVAAFDFMYVNELANNPDVKSIFERRVDLLAAKACLDPQRIKDWIFVRLILMAAWHVEDNSDPVWAIKLAQSLM